MLEVFEFDKFFFGSLGSMVEHYAWPASTRECSKGHRFDKPFSPCAALGDPDETIELLAWLTHDLHPRNLFILDYYSQSCCYRTGQSRTLESSFFRFGSMVEHHF